MNQTDIWILFEHHQFLMKEESELNKFTTPYDSIYFKNQIHQDFCCFATDAVGKPNTSYFIGVDWLKQEENKAVYVQPKLNRHSTSQVDYVKMLFELMEHPEVYPYMDSIYDIKWKDKPITIQQYQDQLTPLLIVQYLQILKRIVRKGLKKSYYQVQQNLNSKVKGKVLVGQNIKQNLVKNRMLYTVCSFEEFGMNGLENRLLKKALTFAQRYLSNNNINTIAELSNIYNYINPAFGDVSEEVSLHEVKHSKVNSFYKEYEEGLRLAKYILKRFGYNINNTRSTIVETPPFWIDMSKLFELYVLGLLRDCHGNNILYGDKAKANYGLPDYLFTAKGHEMILDAKYREIYQSKSYYIDNIRQIAGYARDEKVIDKLGLTEKDVIPCVIIYPTISSSDDVKRPGINLLEGEKKTVGRFSLFYRIGVGLPILGK